MYTARSLVVVRNQLVRQRNKLKTLLHILFRLKFFNFCTVVHSSSPLKSQTNNISRIIKFHSVVSKRFLTKKERCRSISIEKRRCTIFARVYALTARSTSRFSHPADHPPFIPLNAFHLEKWLLRWHLTRTAPLSPSRNVSSVALSVSRFPS